MANQTINLDFTPQNFQPCLYFSQDDVGRVFQINLQGIEVPSGATVTIRATKPSGLGFTVEADSVADNIATFTTVATMTNEHGRFPAEIHISSGSVEVGTANFLMVGEKNPHPDTTVDGDAEQVIPQLTLLVERVETAASSVLDMEVEAQTLPAGSAATYSYDEEENKVTFGIPEGQAGSGAVGTVASAYSATKTYAVGDYAIQNGNLYRCTTAITTAESFTAAHWTQVVLGDDVTDLKSDLSVEMKVGNTGEHTFHPTIVNGYTINKTTGALVPQSGSTQYVVTDLVPVIEGTNISVDGQYVASWSSDGWVAYGADKETVVGHGAMPLDTTGAKYFRLSNYSSTSDHSALTVSYKSVISQSISVISQSIEDNADSINETRAFADYIKNEIYAVDMVNGADFSNITDDSIFNETSGGIESSSYFMVLNNYQPVSGNSVYTAWENRSTGDYIADSTARVLFYDSLKRFIGIGTKNNGVWTSPSNAVFCRVCCRKVCENYFVLKAGLDSPKNIHSAKDTAYKVNKTLSADIQISYRGGVKPKITTAYIVDTDVTRAPMPIFCTSANYIYSQNYSAPIYALTVRISNKQHLYKSKDGGNTWTKIGEFSVSESSGEIINHI